MEEKNKSVQKRIYDAVLQDILRGMYSSQTIITEPALIEKHNVSKTSIREALVKLCGEGVLRNIPRCGYQLVQLTAREISDVLDMRLLLETGALEKSFKFLTDADLQHLEGKQTEQIDVTIEANIFSSWKKNMDFHLELCNLCQNRFMYTSLRQVFNLCSIGANQAFLQTWGLKHSQNGPNHRNLLASLRAGNLENAKRILADDILSMKNA